MNKAVTIGLSAAAVVVALVVGAQVLIAPDRGMGGDPLSTATPQPSASRLPMPEGELPAGTYQANPLVGGSLRLTITVPPGWLAYGDAPNRIGLVPVGGPGTGAPGGIGIQFDDVTSLNADPCQWSGTEDDLAVGSSVDDLVEALRAQSAYDVSEPVDVTIGGYIGKRVDIIHPTELFSGTSTDAPTCDQAAYRVWNTRSSGDSGVRAQGPANRWQANILDVDGTRLVIVTQDFPGTSAADRAEMDAMVESIAIEP